MRRRRVFRVIVLYAIAGWIVIEVSGTLLPGLNLPEWTSTLILLLVLPGFILAVGMARVWLEHDSDLAPLRTDPRFQQLLERMA